MEKGDEKGGKKQEAKNENQSDDGRWALAYILT
jgi:hypothetical protein